MGHAILAGVSFGVASLAKGFVVGPSILFLGYFLQVALNIEERIQQLLVHYFWQCYLQI